MRRAARSSPPKTCSGMSAGPRAVDHLGNSYMQFLFDQSKFNSPSGTAFSLKMPKLPFISLGTTGNGYCLQKTPIRGGSLPNFPRGETTKGLRLAYSPSRGLSSSEALL